MQSLDLRQSWTRGGMLVTIIERLSGDGFIDV